ncbi:UNVERIFIED_CONTAM: hypothetical protein GTU68_003337 [Idotea baltica]|nr:hypothetical protein [Idotea baltica]
MIVSAIVAASNNGVIGNDNQLPWHLPADLKYFKRKTLDHHVVMGKNTFFSIGFPLPKRTNIVLTRDPFFVADGFYVAHSVYEALEIAYEADEEEVFIIGGAQVYTASMDYLDKIYLTRVDISITGDTYLPEILPEDWKLVSETKHEPDDKNEFPYAFLTYERIPKD